MDIWCNLIQPVYLQRGQRKMLSNMGMALMVFQRSSHNADLQSQPVFLLQCFIIGGLGRQKFVDAILHSLKCHAWPVDLSARPGVSWVSSTSQLILDKAFSLSVSAWSFHSQSDAFCIFDKCTQVISLMIVSWRGNSVVVFCIWNYSSLYFTLQRHNVWSTSAALSFVQKETSNFVRS